MHCCTFQRFDYRDHWADRCGEEEYVHSIISQEEKRWNISWNGESRERALEEEKRVAEERAAGDID
jgi:hypothetical protein